MKRYEVRVSAAARQDIRDVAAYIAEEQPSRASQWLNGIGEAMADPQSLRRRAARARQSDRLTYEVRRRVVSEHLVFFTIDEPAKIIYCFASGQLGGGRWNPTAWRGRPCPPCRRKTRSDSSGAPCLPSS